MKKWNRMFGSVVTLPLIVQCDIYEEIALFC